MKWILLNIMSSKLCLCITGQRETKLLCSLTSERVLHMPFACWNQISNAKIIFSVSNGTKFPKFFLNTILCKKFLVQYWILRKFLDFSSFQDHSRISLVLLSSPVPSRIFPELSLATRPDISSLVPVPAIREVTSSPVPSCLKKSSGPQTFTLYVSCERLFLGVLKIVLQKNLDISKAKFQNGFFVTKPFQKFIHLINLSTYHDVLLLKASSIYQSYLTRFYCKESNLICSIA